MYEFGEVNNITKGGGVVIYCEAFCREVFAANAKYAPSLKEGQRVKFEYTPVDTHHINITRIIKQNNCPSK